MNKLLLLLLILSGSLVSYHAKAQGENNVWAFGDSIGLDFSAGDPVVISTNIRTLEDCGTVCDAEGNLLFYNGTNAASDGLVFDRTHSVMPNGSGMLGNLHTSATQGVRIIPFMDGTDRYYLFIQSSFEEFALKKQTYLYYSIVDMSLRGGLGDVVSGYKNIVIDSFTSEKMTATLGLDCSAWLIVHRADTSVLHAFHIDASGLNTTPVISGFPSDRSFGTGLGEYPPFLAGGMDITPDGRYLVRARNKAPQSIDLFDFDKSTGVFSNKQILDDRFSYWVHFSPDGSKLYTSSPFDQYDMSLLPSLAAVKASKYTIRDTNENSGMRNGVDNRLYSIVKSRTSTEFTIVRLDNPNLAKLACGYNRYMTLGPGLLRSNSFGQTILVPETNDTISSRRDTSICFTPDGQVNAPPGYKGYKWNDGTIGKTRTVKAPGKIWVRMRKGCTLYVDTINVIAKALDTVISKKDTTICFTAPIKITAPFGKAYKWYDNDTNRTKSFSTGGVYWVGYYNGDECNYFVDTLNLKSSTNFDTSYTIADTIVCMADPLLLSAGTGYEHYKWYNGSTALSQTVLTAGNYWVIAYNNCSIRIDSFNIKAKLNDSTFYRKDTIACLMQPLGLTLTPGYKSYLWSDGSTATNLTVNKAGLYWAVSSNNCSIRLDSFVVQSKTNDTSFFKTDSMVCFADKLTLNAPAGFTNHIWSNNTTASFVEIFSDKIIWVSSFNEDCAIRIDSFDIRFINFDIPMPGLDSICGESKLILDATTNNASYLWQDGSTLPTFEVSKAGNYIVMITVGPCTAKHTTVVTKREFSISLGDDKKVCEDTPIILNPDIAADAYKWKDGSTNNAYEVKESGTYWLEVLKGNCIARDTVKIEIIRCNHCISIPNAFTPDKNGRNDFFRPLLECPALSYALKIFNRYGQEVFASTNHSDKWDGTFQNKELELGVYYYFLKVQFDYPGSKEELYKGDISLIR